MWATPFAFNYFFLFCYDTSSLNNSLWKDMTSTVMALSSSWGIPGRRLTVGGDIYWKYGWEMVEVEIQMLLQRDLFPEIPAVHMRVLLFEYV